jgi:hypothetical protein
MGGRPLLDLTGQVFGTRIAIKRASNTQGGEATWLMKCTCGDLSEIRGTELRAGRANTCTFCSRVKEHLYMIQSGDYITIGSTSDIRKRIRSYRTHNPIAKLVGYWPGLGHLEYKWHEALKDLRIDNREWFKVR